MILVVNCFYEDNLAANFDQAVAGHLAGTGRPSRFLRWNQLAHLGDPAAYTHLIISGSVASATEDQPWDQPLGDLVRLFVAWRRPVLGICYGHQFLARILAGRDHVRRAAAPEFGFVDLDLPPNPLFRGLAKPLLMVSHNDEAFDLPGEFSVLASGPACGVYAFQYRGLPVWGVQFHPEYSAADGDYIWKEVFCCTPGMIPAPPPETRRMDQNRKIFHNFAAMGS
jgi:GMP synthase (glutamine-hydrolysing)